MNNWSSFSFKLFSSSLPSVSEWKGLTSTQPVLIHIPNRGLTSGHYCKRWFFLHVYQTALDKTWSRWSWRKLCVELGESGWRHNTSQFAPLIARLLFHSICCHRRKKVISCNRAEAMFAEIRNYSTGSYLPVRLRFANPSYSQFKGSKRKEFIILDE